MMQDLRRDAIIMMLRGVDPSLNDPTITLYRNDQKISIRVSLNIPSLVEDQYRYLSQLSNALSSITAP